LRNVPGIGVSANGGVGSLTSVRLRGGEADQTVLLIDGVQQNDPSTPGGGYNFGNLLIGDLERIEVLRGPQSTLYGSQAIGGVINLITRQPRKVFEGSAIFETGDLATHSIRASVRGKAQGLNYALSAGRFESDSISAAASGTERDDFQNTSVQASATYRLNAVIALEARAWLSQGDVGIDGFPAPSFSLADTPERSKTDEQILYGAAHLTSLDGRWRTVLSASQSRIDRENINPTLAVPVTFRGLGQTDRISVQSTLDASARVQFVAGLESETAQFETASPSSFNPNPAPSLAEVDLSAVYAQVQLTPIDGLNATLGVRQSDHEQFGAAINTRATLAWAFNDGNTVVRAAVADGFKAPTLFQLYSNFGNRGLKPEEASSVEGGIEQGFFGQRLVMGATWFERATTNQIDFASCFGDTSAKCVGRPFGTYDNIARTKARGIEASFSFRPTTSISVTGGLTQLNARNDVLGSANFGRSLARRPKETSFVRASYSFGAKGMIEASLFTSGAAFENGSNTVRLAPYQLIGLRGQWALSPHWQIYARVENAGDEAYQTSFGYNAPPRQTFVGLRADF
jgi:vitamin B12 transporter